MVRDFLGRDEEFAAFRKWLNEEFEGEADWRLQDEGVNDFLRIALSFEGAEQGSHFGAADFRVGGRIFATLASVKEGYGNLMLTPEQQAEFIAGRPICFFPSMADGAGTARPTSAWPRPTRTY